MAEVKLTIKPPIKLPVFTGLSRKFWDDVGHVVIGNTLNNIHRQIDIDGGKLKKNQPKTIRYKRKKRWGVRSLVAEKRRFVQSNSWVIKKFLARGRGVVVEANGAELKKLIGYTWKKGYMRYFGISTKPRSKSQRAIAALLKNEIMDQFKKAVKKVRIT